jgi:hypothetical protein
VITSTLEPVAQTTDLGGLIFSQIRLLDSLQLISTSTWQGTAGLVGTGTGGLVGAGTGLVGTGTGGLIGAGTGGLIGAGTGGLIGAGTGGLIGAGTGGLVGAGTGGLVGAGTGGLVGARTGGLVGARTGGLVGARTGGLVGARTGGLVGVRTGGLVGLTLKLVSLSRKRFQNCSASSSRFSRAESAVATMPLAAAMSSNASANRTFGILNFILFRSFSSAKNSLVVWLSFKQNYEAFALYVFAETIVSCVALGDRLLVYLVLEVYVYNVDLSTNLRQMLLRILYLGTASVSEPN